MLKISFNLAMCLTTTALFSISSCIGSNVNGDYDDEAAFQEALRRSTISYDEDAALEEALHLSQPKATSSSAPKINETPIATQKTISAATVNKAPALTKSPKEDEKARRNREAVERIKAQIIGGAAKRQKPTPVAAPALRVDGAPIAAPKPVGVQAPIVALEPLPVPLATVPKPIISREFVLEEEKAIGLSNYILGQRSQSRTTMMHRVEELVFIDGEFGCFQNLPIFAQESIMQLSFDRVKAYSEEKGIPVSIAHSLLNYFLSFDIAKLRAFDQAHAELKLIMEGQKFKTEAEPILLKSSMMHAASFEDAEKNKPLALAALEKFNVVSIYAVLKKNAEDFGKLLVTSRETFIDKSGLRPHILKKAPEGNLLADEALPAPQGKLFKLGAQLEPLPAKITTLQDSLNGEFNERQKNNHNETVMAYGSIICPQYHEDLQSNIAFLFQRMKFKEVKDLVDVQKILDFFDQVSQDLELGTVHRTTIMKALTISLRHQTNPAQGIVYATPDRSLKPQTQYQYMMTVASQFHRIYMSFKDEPEVKASLDTLLQMFFSTLSDQGEKCQAGMVGRMLMVQKSLFDTLVDLYSKGLSF